MIRALSILVIKQALHVFNDFYAVVYYSIDWLNSALVPSITDVMIILLIESHVLSLYLDNTRNK